MVPAATGRRAARSGGKCQPAGNISPPVNVHIFSQPPYRPHSASSNVDPSVKASLWPHACPVAHRSSSWDATGCTAADRDAWPADHTAIHTLPQPAEPCTAAASMMAMEEATARAAQSQNTEEVSRGDLKFTPSREDGPVVSVEVRLEGGGPRLYPPHRAPRALGC